MIKKLNVFNYSKLVCLKYRLRVSLTFINIIILFTPFKNDNNIDLIAPQLSLNFSVS